MISGKYSSSLIATILIALIVVEVKPNSAHAIRIDTGKALFVTDEKFLSVR